MILFSLAHRRGMHSDSPARCITAVAQICQFLVFLFNINSSRSRLLMCFAIEMLSTLAADKGMLIF